MIALVLAAATLVVAHVAQPIPEDDAVTITGLVQHNLHVADLDASLAREGAYVLVYWKASDEHPAGQALVKKSSSGWVVVRQVAGSLADVKTLEGLGVPQAQAEALAADYATPP